MTLSVLVLSGGISHERDVSIRGGHRLAEALQRLGVAVRIAEPARNLLQLVTRERPDVIWPVLHGAGGEDGTLREILSLTDVPFVGTSAAACRLAWSKPVAKAIAKRAGASTPSSVTITRTAFSELDVSSVLSAAAARIGLPLVVKPEAGGSAQGVTIVRDGSALAQALIDAFSYAEAVLIERFVPGTEVAVTILEGPDGTEILPSVEIVPLDGDYDFSARYTAGSTEFYVPARFAPSVVERLASDAGSIARALDLRGLSRLDFIVDSHGVPWFIDANVMPGLTETSLSPLAIRGSGRSEGDVYLDLAQQAAAAGAVI